MAKRVTVNTPNGYMVAAHINEGFKMAKAAGLDTTVGLVVGEVDVNYGNSFTVDDDGYLVFVPPVPVATND